MKLSLTKLNYNNNEPTTKSNYKIMQNETVNLFCKAFGMKIEQNSSDSIDWNCWEKYRQFLWQMNIFNSKKAVILILYRKKAVIFYEKKHWFSFLN